MPDADPGAGAAAGDRQGHADGRTCSRRCWWRSTSDHQPLYRQEAIFERAGLAIPRSTLAQWVGACGVQLQPLVDALRAALLERSVLHADETPVAMLMPGKGKTHRAYIWSYSSTRIRLS